jgi:hypothetical protein
MLLAHCWPSLARSHIRRLVSHSLPGRRARYPHCLGADGGPEEYGPRQVRASIYAELTATDAGYRSIGISNFSVKDTQVLLDSAKIVPAVNQVCFIHFTSQRCQLEVPSSPIASEDFPHALLLRGTEIIA